MTSESIVTPTIRPVAPTPFSGQEKPRIDPRDHVFSLEMWLRDVPADLKLHYATTTLAGIARQEWRLQMASLLKSNPAKPPFDLFKDWFITRFTLINAAEQSRPNSQV